MDPRAIRNLAQLADRDLFPQISMGLNLVAKNVNRLGVGMQTLGDAGQYHGAQVLSKIAEEETATFLILLDVARCPRQPGEPV